MTTSTEQNSSLAIVGMAARLPDAAGVEAFWRNLVAGRECIRTFTREELLAAGNPPEVVDDPAYVPAAGVPDDIAGIDLNLFGLTRGEAELIDPQQRLFLECVWEALEDAGSMLPDEEERRTGVFASCDLSTYLPAVLAPRVGLAGAVKEFQIEIGNDKDFLATRVSYKLDLRGPSVGVQTACSSSLVAVHLACESLLSGACDVAVAGGSRLHVPFPAGQIYHDGGVSAAEPHCRAFDAAATGTVRGNGTAVVVLKRTEDAIADGDRIYAVVLGSAINNDGAEKVGFAAPSVAGQRAAIREALAVAGVDPGEVGYVETHGTGTALGDPIEVEALADALAARDPDRRPCVLGAVKTNVGHLGSASGVTGLIKAALALDRGVVPGTLHFTSANPELRLHEMRFVIKQDATPWPRQQDERRVAGVSSFGIGGTNCHVILADAPSPVAARDGDMAQLLVLSGATPSALRSIGEALADRIQADNSAMLASVARTLQIGRRALRHRFAAVVRSRDDAVVRLHELIVAPDRAPVAASGVCMLFPGQGTEFAGMADDTMAEYPSFREDVERCAELLRHEGIDLFSFLDSGDIGSESSRTAVVQPALFAIEVSLAHLWMSWGVRPTAVVGHSIGEYAAAAVAGVFTLEDGIRLTAARGRAMAAAPPGAMTAVLLGEHETRNYLPAGVWVAGVNAPAMTVVAGAEAAIATLEDGLSTDSVSFKRLRVDRAFHTPGLRAVVSELARAFEDVRLDPPRIPLFSNRTGAALSGLEAVSPEYWIGQALSPVRFMDCIRAADTSAAYAYLEVGPGAGLGQAVRQTLGAGTARVLATIGSTPAAERPTMLGALGSLWEAGESIDWARVSDGGAVKASLPTYPFERRRCWFGDATVSAVDAELAHRTVTSGSLRAAPRRDESARTDGDPTAAVLQIVGDVMGVGSDEIKADVAFVEQGLESLALLEVAEKVRRLFGVRVTLPDLLDDLATVSALVGRLQQVGAKASPGPAESTPEPLAPPRGEAEPSAAPATPFGPRRSDGALKGPQQAYLAEMVPRYVARTAASKAYNARYLPAHADPRNSAGFRSAWKEIVYPIVADRSDGAWIWDLDGNRYVDLTMSFGVALFGHSPRFIADALARQLEKGFAVGPQTQGSGVVAEQVCRVTGFERVAFTNSGTEAVMTAIRLARAATRRNRIVVFRGSYHGTYDGVLARAGWPGAGAAPAALGVPESLVRDVVVLPYGSDDVFELLRAGGETIAAVLAEPVQSRNPSLQPRLYLERLRDATAKVGALLVLDEMISGFRCHPGGINALWALDADIATYGKVLGGGMPIGAVAGRASVLDLVDGGAWTYGDDSRPEADLTFFAGTFCKHPFAMAAASAVLTELERQGTGLQDRLSQRASGLVRQLRAEFDELDCAIDVEQFSSLFSFRPGSADSIGELFFKAMALRGVYIWEGRTSFLSTAHSAADLEHVVTAAAETARELLDAQVIERRGRRPTPGAPLPGSFPCRDEQHLLWLGMEMHPEATAAYNEVVTIPLAGDLDQALVAESVRSLVARNDALRLRIGPTGQWQWTDDSAECPLEVIDAGHAETRWKRAADLVSSLRSAAFDLERGPVVRAALLRLRPAEHVVVLVAPHLCVDGWSLSLLRSQFEEAYAALVGGRRAHECDAPRFADFVRWECAQLADDGGRSAVYWEERLRGVDPAPMLRGAPAAVRTHEARSLRRQLDFVAARRLGTLCAAISVTPFSAGLAAWCATLSDMTGRPDIVVAITLAGQPRAATFDVVGYCLKVLPIRMNVTDVPFAALVAETHSAVLEAQEHWFVPESALISEHWSRRDRTRSPMGGVTFQYERPERTVALPGATPIDVDLVGRPVTKWDATMVLFGDDRHLTAELVYTPSVLDKENAAALLDRYVEILDRGCRDAPSRAAAATRAPDAEHGSPRLIPIETSD